MSRVASRLPCVASRRVALLQVAGHRDAFSRRRIPPSLSTNSLSAAQHRRWNPRRNFRFRRGSRALAEPKDDRSASEIVRDNSPPCGFLLSLSLFLPSVISLYLSRICFFSLLRHSFSLHPRFISLFFLPLSRAIYPLVFFAMIDDNIVPDIFLDLLKIFLLDDIRNGGGPTSQVIFKLKYNNNVNYINNIHVFSILLIMLTKKKFRYVILEKKFSFYNFA